jgi:hypothetical protein
MTNSIFLRTCQSCGNKQEDKDPKGKQPGAGYCNRKCKRCGSSDLDYGSTKYEE